MKYQTVDENGNLEPSPIDFALGDHLLLALCGQSAPTAKSSGTPFVPLPADRLSVKR
jgi:D-alanyl-D-alanine carboxypeptidase